MDRPFDELTRLVVRFRDERDWAQFHHPKDIAVSIAIEAAELLEHFQWKDREEVSKMLADPSAKAQVGDELADVLILLLSAAEVMGVDLFEAVIGKVKRNAEKYPVEKSRGNARKYDRLDD